MTEHSPFHTNCLLTLSCAVICLALIEALEFRERLEAA
jgi:hypothetical protein